MTDKLTIDSFLSKCLQFEDMGSLSLLGEQFLALKPTFEEEQPGNHKNFFFEERIIEVISESFKLLQSKNFFKEFPGLFNLKNPKRELVRLSQIINFLITYLAKKNNHFIHSPSLPSFLRNYVETFLFRNPNFLSSEEILDTLLYFSKQYSFLSEIILSLEKQPGMNSQYERNFFIFLNLKLANLHSKLFLENGKFAFSNSFKKNDLNQNISISFVDSFLNDSLFENESKEIKQAPKKDFILQENKSTHSELTSIMCEFFEINFEGNQ